MNQKVKVPARFRKNEYVALIIELARILEPEVYCEIGVYQCHTINRLLPYVGEAIGVDIEDKRKHFDKSLRNWSFFKGDSKEFSDSYSGPKIDLLFIDADHDNESVMADINNMRQHVRPETGIVLLHDTYPVKRELIQPGYCNNAWEAAKEIHRSRNGWEIVTIPKPWAGLSILRKLDSKCHGWMDRED